MKHLQSRILARIMPLMLLLCLCQMPQTISAGTAPANQPFAQLFVSRDNIHFGEPFVVTILITGGETPAKPDLSHIRDFRTSFISAQPTADTDRPGCTMQYRFVPNGIGELTIPPIAVTVAARQIRTRPVTVSVLAPQISERLTLRMTADKDECFVGEPVILTIQWHIEFDLQNVKAVDMRLPVLHDERFDVFEPHLHLAAGDKNAIGLPVSDTRIISNGQSQTVDGVNITTLTFSRIIVPKQPGLLDLPPATVICAAISAPAKARRQWNQYPSYFDNDFFEKDIGANYQRLFTKSGGLTLKVKPLPPDGRPQGFGGLVCTGCDISVTAEPTTVSVGAPVTVTIRLSTASGIEHIDLPPLGDQPALANDFKIPGQRSPAVVKDNVKTFTQSIRPLRTDVDEVAAIELTYFDYATGKYVTAASQPVPLVVNEADAVTDLSDGQGPAADRSQNRPRSLFSGLMHNYEDEGILKNAGTGIFGWGGGILWAFILILPPLIYAKLAVTSAIVKARQIDPKARRHKAAYGSFEKRLNQIRHDSGKMATVCTDLDQSLRQYLADKLERNAGALIYGDIADQLRAEGVADETLTRLKDLFDECEVHSFANAGNTAAGAAEITERADKIITEIEGSLK